MKHVKHTFAILGLAFAVSACYKAGCTNPDATNYNPDVDTEDQSCEYSGKLVFWCTQAVSDSLIDVEGHDMLRFELEGALVDSIATANLHSASGDCDAAGTKTLVRTLPGNEKRTYHYRVKGLGLQTIYEGFIEVEANECTAVKLL